MRNEGEGRVRAVLDAPSQLNGNTPPPWFVVYSPGGRFFVSGKAERGGCGARWGAPCVFPKRTRERASMTRKTYIPEGEQPPASQVAATVEALAATIAARRDAGEESYTNRLLTGKLDDLLKKVMEESGEVALAAKDADAALYFACEAAEVSRGSDLACGLAAEADAQVDHLRYEAADVVYHLLVVLERFGISLDEFAAELNERMAASERPRGAVRLHGEHVKRGK